MGMIEEHLGTGPHTSESFDAYKAGSDARVARQEQVENGAVKDYTRLMGESDAHADRAKALADSGGTLTPKGFDEYNHDITMSNMRYQQAARATKYKEAGKDARTLLPANALHRMKGTSRVAVDTEEGAK